MHTYIIYALRLNWNTVPILRRLFHYMYYFVYNLNPFPHNRENLMSAISLHFFVITTSLWMALWSFYSSNAYVKEHESIYQMSHDTIARCSSTRCSFARLWLIFPIDLTTKQPAALSSLSPVSNCSYYKRLLAIGSPKEIRFAKAMSMIERLAFWCVDLLDPYGNVYDFCVCFSEWWKIAWGETWESKKNYKLRFWRSA